MVAVGDDDGHVVKTDSRKRNSDLESVRLSGGTRSMVLCRGFFSSCIALALLIPVSAQAQQGTGAARSATRCQPQVSAGGRVVQIDWALAKACLDKPNAIWKGRLTNRIDEDASVTITSTSFNFLKYTIKYQIDETVVDSYVLLAKLWQGIVGLGLPALDTEIRGLRIAQQDPILAWLNSIGTAQAELDLAAGRVPPAPFLTNGQIADVKADTEKMLSAREDVMRRYGAVITNFPSFTAFEQFNKVKVFHDAVLSRLDAYVDLAALAVSGQVKTIPKKNAGTIVTVTLTPVTTGGAERPPSLTIEYFSHSRLPLTFHVGYAVGNLKELEFEQVTAFAGGDLFTQVRSNNKTEGMAALMTYDLWSRHDGKLAVGVTLGTDVKKPGQRMMAGGSFRVGRIVATIGGMLGELKEGANPVIENLSGGVTRQLFGSIITRRDSARFFAVSVKVF
jgi:hypothetical protein